MCDRACDWAYGICITFFQWGTAAWWVAAVSPIRAKWPTARCRRISLHKLSEGKPNGGSVDYERRALARARDGGRVTESVTALAGTWSVTGLSWQCSGVVTEQMECWLAIWQLPAARAECYASAALVVVRLGRGSFNFVLSFCESGPILVHSFCASQGRAYLSFPFRYLVPTPTSTCIYIHLHVYTVCTKAYIPRVRRFQIRDVVMVDFNPWGCVLILTLIFLKVQYTMYRKPQKAMSQCKTGSKRSYPLQGLWA